MAVFNKYVKIRYSPTPAETTRNQNSFFGLLLALSTWGTPLKVVFSAQFVAIFFICWLLEFAILFGSSLNLINSPDVSFIPSSFGKCFALVPFHFSYKADMQTYWANFTKWTLHTLQILDICPKSYLRCIFCTMISTIRTHKLKHMQSPQWHNYGPQMYVVRPWPQSSVKWYSTHDLSLFSK